MTPESLVKRYLRKRCDALGWKCLALILPHRRGWPDRTIIAHAGRVAFVECKARGIKHARAHIARQKKMLDELSEFGHLVFFAVGRSGVDEVIENLSKNWGVSPGKEKENGC